VLNGVQTGAESVLPEGRTLVGNLPSECDLLLDIGTSDRHVCLLRHEAGALTALSVAGDLWIGTRYVAPRDVVDAAFGDVLTLGRTSFAVAPRGASLWEQLQPPRDLTRPEAGGAVPVTAEPQARDSSVQRWGATRVAAGVALALMVAGQSLAILLGPQATAGAVSAQLSSAEALHQSVRKLNAQSQAQLVVETRDDRVVVQGIVAAEGDAEELRLAALRMRLPVQLRVVPAADLQRDLRHGMRERLFGDVTYAGAGVFEAATDSANLESTARSAQTALENIRADWRLQLRVLDVQRRGTEEAATLLVRRGDDPRRLVEQLPRRSRELAVIGVREGQLGSILTQNGTRYFVGARLPDGSLLAHVGGDRVHFVRGDYERVELVGESQAAYAERLESLAKLAQSARR
jgi:hypothetical protein